MWFKVLEKPPEPNAMAEISVGDNQLVLTNYNGKLYCFNNRCPHEDFQLSFGCVQKGKVKCSLHGFSFDLVSGESSEEGVESLNLFRVKIEKDVIYVEINPDQ
ncbi:MAG TPA: (2Fe-2S)-binding protein [Candidatus Thioglobus sp.]|jgi:3-phenylpropionate/trans-cinnamate dioxygenase ferredoxin subunit|nr:(2Fe-2S)-binding protein [Candidatus Thioglobus sp.]HIL20017.1 (2Fe-2S)-binding protein [Candidatus Thioglobus sp.]